MKINNPFTVNPTPIPINIKYAPTAVIPSELTDGKHIAQKYRLYGGEVVTFRFLGTWDNRSGCYDTMFDKVCREMYDIDFATVRSVWQRRLGELSEYWHKVEMRLAE